MSLTEYLNQGWVSLLASAVIGAVSVFLPIKLNSKPRLRYFRNYFRLLSSFMGAYKSKIAIFYDGTQIDSLYCVRLYFWNSGRATLRGSDIAESDRIRLVHNREIASIIDVHIRSVTRLVINPKLQHDGADGSTYILFDFLDYMDGFSVDCILSGAVTSVDVAGTIIGSRRGCELAIGSIDPLVKDKVPQILEVLDRAGQYFHYFFFFAGVVAAAVGLLSGYIEHIFPRTTIEPVVAYGLSVGAFVYSVSCWAVLRKKYPRELDAEDFRSQN